MNISSSVFQPGGPLPSKYTCDGEDISPPLTLSGVPAESQSLALIVDDPDAPRGDWVHWLLWNIPPNTGEILENSVPAGAVQGLTDFRRNDWGGPCPPSGVHRYFFKLYALDTVLDLPANSGKAELEVALQGHILAEATLMGTYTRQ